MERNFEGQLDQVRSLVGDLFKKQGIVTNGVNGCGETNPAFSTSLNHVKEVLGRFKDRIQRHPAVLSSPATIQQRLACELENFLLAHIQQAEDNHRFRSSDPEPSRSFYNWVQRTSADHTSCPFSFVFFHCLVVHDSGVSSSPQRLPDAAIPYLASARAAYLAEDACRHLANLCRMYNDMGSVARDADERSLNSVDFPEFSFEADNRAAGVTTETLSRRKKELLWIAEYERRGLEMAMAALGEEAECDALVRALRLFIDVTDLYGQVYILKDIGTRTQ